jgi:hypothetical protein
MTPNEIKAKVWHHAALWVQNLLNADYPQDTQNPGGPPESETEQAAMRKEMQRVVWPAATANNSTTKRQQCGVQKRHERQVCANEGD